MPNDEHKAQASLAESPGAIKKQLKSIHRTQYKSEKRQSKKMEKGKQSKTNCGIMDCSWDWIFNVPFQRPMRL